MKLVFFRKRKLLLIMFSEKVYLNLGMGHMHELQYIGKNH